MRSCSSAKFLCFGLLSSAIGSLSTVVIAGEINWASPIDGYWRETSNWLEGSTPGRFNGAVLGLTGEYTVYFDFHELVQSISIPNPNATLELLKSAELDIIESVENNGYIRISSTQSQSEAILRFNNTQSLFGTGKLILGSPDAELRVDDNRVLTQESDHQIEGAGRIFGDMLNHGTIQSISGGTLEIYESIIDQSPTGVSRAANPNSVLHVNGSRIRGGRVETTNGGMILLEDTGVLENIQMDNNVLIGADGHSYISGATLNDVDLVIFNMREDSDLYLDNNFDFQGTGNFYIQMSDLRSFVQLADGFILPESYQISGYGAIDSVNFVNNSLILSNFNNEELRVNLTVNQGLLGAENGATLVIDGSINNEDGKIFATGTDSKILVEPTRTVFIDNGTLLTDNGGILVNKGGLFLDNVLLLCNIHSTTSSGVFISGLVYHNKQILIDNATLNFDPLSYIYGPGTVILRGKEALMEPSSLTNGPDHRFEGEGTIGDYSTLLYNGGVFSANTSGGTLRLEGRKIENYGRFESVNGASLRINTSIDQSSIASIDAIGLGSSVDLIGTGSIRWPYSIDGGILNTEEGGIFRVLDDSKFNDVIINAEIVIIEAVTLSISGDSVINGVLISASKASEGGDIEILNPSSLNGSGTIRLSSINASSQIIGGTAQTPLTVGPEFRIEGNGTLTGPVVCNGTLAPGLEIGLLNCVQDLVLTDQAVFEVHISPAASDLLQVQSSCRLAGEVLVQFTDGFHPTTPWSREVLVSDELIIETVTLTMPDSPTGLVSRIFTNDSSMRVGQSYLSDMNLDGIVDLFDINTFLNAFSSGSLVSDLNGDLILDFYDIAVFIQSFQDNF